MKIKICGVTNIVDAKAIAAFEPWAMGLNFYAKSPRFVSLSKAQDIIKYIPLAVERIGVFVNATKDEIVEAVTTLSLNCVQLHGDEDRSFCESLGVPFIKVFRPRTASDLNEAAEYVNSVHFRAFLIDGVSPNEYGGTGVRAGLHLALNLKTFGPVILAGGLTAENVASACRDVKPFAVDVTSGVERTPGIKDQEKLKHFFQQVQRK